MLFNNREGDEQTLMSTVSFYLFRGGSEIATVGTVGQEVSAAKDIKIMCPILYLDSPGSAASHTYEIKVQDSSNTATRVNVTTSFLVLQEISS